MITAKNFALLGSVWHPKIPSLEQFTRWVNRNSQTWGHLVRRYEDSSRNSLIAETAFAVVAHSAQESEAEGRARRFLDGLPRPPSHNSLSDGERYQVDRIANNLRGFLEFEEHVVFNPRLGGCGVVDLAHADILAGRHLIEVKAVDRGFRGTDFRQLLTYAALSYAEDRNLTKLTLLNPRQGRYYSSDSENLALDLGAASWVELMQGLIETMTDAGVSQ